MKKTIISLFLFLTLISVSTQTALAQSKNNFPNAGSAKTSASSSGKSSDPTCMGGNGIDTAIGCIPISDTNAFMGWVLGWAIGVGGGIAFLLIVYASFMVMTSSGDPARLKAGQELLTSAISGLIMLIFSVFILKFIGIDILGLGQFGFGV